MDQAAQRQATFADLLQVLEPVVAEVLNGELHTHPRPASRHARALSVLGAEPVSDALVNRLMRRRREDPPVLVYCYRGNHSRDLCGFLSQLGLRRVYNLEGGWQAWKAW